MKYFSLIALILALSLFIVSCSSKDDVGDETSDTLSEDTSDLMSDLDDEKDKIEDDMSDEKDDLSDTLSDDEEMLDDDMTDNNDNAVDLPDNNVLPASNTDFESLDNSIKTWGQGHNVDDENRPIASLDYQEIYGEYDTFFIKEGEKKIHLTFDEGYENGFTPQILDVLKEKDCPATFFVTLEYAEKNHDLITRMIDEGHIVGNHSSSHPSFPEISSSEVKSEITLLHDYIEENFDYSMEALRPPRGEFSERTLALTQSMGYETYFWSFAYKDWEVDNQPENSEAYNRLCEAAHDGAIYLLHAVSKTNTEILSDFIDTMREDGYEFSPLI